MSDPITNIFVNRQPTMTEIGDALAKSLSSRNYASPGQAAGVSFGEALNNIRGAKIKEAVQLESINQGRKRIDIAEKGLNLQQLKLEQSLAQQHNKNFDAVWKATGGKLPLDKQSALWESLKKDPNPMDQGDIRGNIYTHMEKLGIKDIPKGKPTLAEIRRDALIERGYSVAQAEDIAFGYIQVATDPITGEHYVINKRTGEKTPTSMRTASGLPKKSKIELQSQNIEIDKLLSRIPDLETAIETAGGGISGGVQEIMSKLGGQIPEDWREALPEGMVIDTATMEAIQKVIEARNTIGLFREDMRKALSANPRMSLQEQNRILGLLPNTEMLSSVEDNKSRLRSVIQRLNSIKADNNIKLGNVSSFKGTKDNPAKPMSQQEYNDLPSGSFFINPADGSLRRKP